jgi:pimeloyl-ACP methyl ester carboxylesterase
MEIFAAVGNWISEQESLLSGAAAIIVLSGVVISALSLLLRQLAGSSKGANASAGAKDEQHITLADLSAPAPYPIHYAHSDGLRIAYAKVGQGPHNILMAPGIISHLNIMSHLPPFRDTTKALAEFANIVTFDKRGQGLSDPSLTVPDLTERVHDIEAVLDAAGMDKVILYGVSEGGPMCVKFALDHPERVQGLILVGTTARWLQGPDFPSGIEERALDAMVPAWGTARLRRIFFPSITPETMTDATYKSFELLVATRSSIKQLVEYMKLTDVRDLLPQLQCPTLVIHFAGDMAIPVRLGRAMADAIPNAEFLELPGTDHADLSSATAGVEKIRQFAESASGG